MPKQGWKPGRWSAICDRCGLEYNSDQLKTEWTGLMVCAPCWEPRHPQDFIRARPEKIVPPWTRPEPEDTFIYVCSIFAWGGADTAEADCAQADAPYRSQ